MLNTRSSLSKRTGARHLFRGHSGVPCDRDVAFSLSPSAVPVTLFLLFFLGSCSFSFGHKPTRRAPPITALNDWLYRGPQPTEAFLLQLKEKGIRTVVDFRDEPKRVEWEKEKVEASGMQYVSLPWNIMKPVDPKLLDRFFEALDDPKNRPIFFHCQHGRDRTGVMATLALMRYEKLSKEEAQGIALETIRPHLRFQLFVNQKIDFFLKERPAYFEGGGLGSPPTETDQEKIIELAKEERRRALSQSAAAA